MRPTINRQQRRRAARAARKKQGIRRPEPAVLDKLLAEAVAHHGAGRLQDALALYDRILADAPDNPDALHLKGVALAQGGAFDDGIAAIRAAIEVRGDSVDYHNNLGNLLWQAGRLGEAEAALRRAIEVAPGHAAAHNNLGNVLEALGRETDAIESYRHALASAPEDAAVHGNLGIFLQKNDRLEEAEEALRRAVDLAPDSPEAENNLGSLLTARGQLEAAEAAFGRAIERNSDYANAHYNLGHLLFKSRRVEAAVRALERAISLDPDHTGARINLGAAFNHLERHEEAETTLREAIDLDPSRAEAHNNLGVSLRAQGYFEAAEDAYRRAVALDPHSAEAHSNLIFTLDFNADYDPFEHQAERRRWHVAHAAPLAGRIRAHQNMPDPDRRLRIGYVSADFRQHSAANAFGPMIVDHDPAGFDVVCYSNNFIEDDVTASFKAAASAWRDCAAIGDADLAEMIRADRIDILVDLSAHTAGNRLLVFARKPAPVQVTGWGHGVGTGMTAIDYFVTDAIVVPDDESALYPETIWHLPSHLPYLPPAAAPDVPKLPAGGPIKYGCFNRLEKFSDGAVALWADIMTAAPEALLVFKSQALDRPRVKADFVERLAEAGINPARVEFRGGSPQPEHLAAHGDIDLMLDPFPHSGGVATLDALWMGVPVVTLRGPSVAHRLAASALHALDLDDFIAETPESYVELALEHGCDRPRLVELRQTLRARVANSPVGDLKAYVTAVEAGYREMWARWCADADTR